MFGELLNGFSQRIPNSFRLVAIGETSSWSALSETPAGLLSLPEPPTPKDKIE
jgi:hypothetical protein